MRVESAERPSPTKTRNVYCAVGDPHRVIADLKWSQRSLASQQRFADFWRTSYYYYHELKMTELGSRIKLLFSIPGKPPLTGWPYQLIPAIRNLSPNWPRVFAISNVSPLFIAFGRQISNRRRRLVVGTGGYEHDVAVISIVINTIRRYYYYIWSMSKIALFKIVFLIKPTNYLSTRFCTVIILINIDTYKCAIITNQLARWINNLF